MNCLALLKSSPTELFLYLARILSPSGNERETADVCRMLLSQMGADVREDDAGCKTGGNAGNLIAVFKGRDVSVPPLMLNAHMDTVDPGGNIEPVIDGDRIVSSGKTILGADNRAGLVMILAGMRNLLQNQSVLPFDVEVVFTVGEESGLTGATHLDYSHIVSKHGFSLDSSGLGKVALAAPYYNAVRIVACGRAAHAGVNPELGINSIAMMSELISQLPFGKIDIETTANIGKIWGGSARNVVPDTCCADIEIRSHSLTRLNACTDNIVRECLKRNGNKHVCIDQQVYRSAFKVDIQREFDGFELDRSDPVVVCAEHSLKDISRKVTFCRNMGGSDANVFNAGSIRSVVLGTGQTNVHSQDEYIKINDLNDGVTLVEKLVCNWKSWWSQKIT